MEGRIHLIFKITNLNMHISICQSWEISPDFACLSGDPTLCPDPKAKAAVFHCIRPSSTSVSAPVGLSGRQPGNYTALTTSQERRAHHHTHTQKHLEYTDHTTPPAHTRYLSLHSLSSSHTHTYTQAQPNTRTTLCQGELQWLQPDLAPQLLCLWRECAWIYCLR